MKFKYPPESERHGQLSTHFGAVGAGVVLCAVRLNAINILLLILVPHPAVAQQTVISRGTSQQQLVGVGSCTAAGCHGAGHPNQIVGSEYNIWISQDPHANAYSILFDERCERMVRLLSPTVPDPTPAHKDARCLACHSTTDAEPHNLRSEIVSDGVGCEACHGPANGWLATHFQQPRDPYQLRASGLEDTDRLVTRAQICVRCHVGSPAGPNGPLRDVHHDLIAAGHPRLQFEMGAYLESLPKHWVEEKDRSGREADFDAAIWAIGQASASQAALTILADRAERAQRSDPRAVWPEFAEWSCTACHHDLRDESARQNRLGESKGKPSRLMSWDMWNHETMRYHVTNVSRELGLQGDAASAIERSLQRIEDEMGNLNPDRQRVAESAREAAKLLHDWAAAIELQRFGPQVIDRLTRVLVERQLSQIESGTADWSSSAQTYDALANLHQARLYAAPNAHGKLTTVVHKIYNDLAAAQRMPAGYMFQSEQLRTQLLEVQRQLPTTESGR